MQSLTHNPKFECMHSCMLSATLIKAIHRVLCRYAFDYFNMRIFNSIADVTLNLEFSQFLALLCATAQQSYCYDATSVHCPWSSFIHRHCFLRYH